MQTPLQALQAALESVGVGQINEAERDVVLRCAIEELRKLRRNVDALVEYTAPPTPVPMRCRVGEILLTVREQVGLESRSRLLVACDDHAPELMVDGPLLVRSLRRVVENALEAGSDQVLFASRDGGSGRTFAVMNNCPSQTLDPRDGAASFASTKTDHIGLGLTLAKRDLELMGGSLTVRRTFGGRTLVWAQLPAWTAVGTRAA